MVNGTSDAAESAARSMAFHLVRRSSPSRRRASSSHTTPSGQHATESRQIDSGSAFALEDGSDGGALSLDPAQILILPTPSADFQSQSVSSPTFSTVSGLSLPTDYTFVSSRESSRSASRSRTRTRRDSSHGTEDWEALVRAQWDIDVSPPLRTVEQRRALSPETPPLLSRSSSSEPSLFLPSSTTSGTVNLPLLSLIASIVSVDEETLFLVRRGSLTAARLFSVPLLRGLPDIASYDRLSRIPIRPSALFRVGAGAETRSVREGLAAMCDVTPLRRFWRRNA